MKAHICFVLLFEHRLDVEYGISTKIKTNRQKKFIVPAEKREHIISDRLATLRDSLHFVPFHQRITKNVLCMYVMAYLHLL